MFEFGNQHALIVGGGRNIGRAIALEFARRGAHISIADIDAAAATEAAALVVAAGGQAMGMACDVTSEASLAAAVAQAERHFGPIDILLNNAGIIHSGNPEDFPVAEWERMFSVNFFGAVRANALVLPTMLARAHGYIVQTASFAGLYPYATSRVPYAASKAALISMSENMAISLLPRGVRVSCLCPGPTMTTATVGMKPWSANVVMRGPGAQFAVRSQEHAARVLADGMCAGRVIIPTDEAVWKLLAQHAAGPDQFVNGKVAEFARGDSGLPGRVAK